jgi:hypothetical protein
MELSDRTPSESSATIPYVEAYFNRPLVSASGIEWLSEAQNDWNQIKIQFSQFFMRSTQRKK